MVFLDNDNSHFARNYPHYIPIFQEYDNILRSEYSAELTLRIRDSTNSDRIILGYERYTNKPLADNTDQIEKIISQLYDKICNTCNFCGNQPAKLKFELMSTLEQNQTAMCDDCYDKLIKGNISSY